MACSHNHYKNGGYMTSRRALREMHAGNIKRMSKIIPNCDKCGANIKYARIVKVEYD